MMQVIRCDACAGSVVYDAHHEAATCLFCGSVALHPDSLAEEIPSPDAALPFEIEQGAAQAAFRGWARSSWWYPKELRGLKVQLREALLPAWRFDARVETHWAGLTRALTKSGLRPVSGVANRRQPILIPASIGLSEQELVALEPFEPTRRQGWRSEDAATPFEMPSMSEVAARRQARDLAGRQHRSLLKKEHRLRRCTGSSLLEVDGTQLLMLPIWIGSFRYRDLPFRFVVNAQTGRVTGKAPLDRVKVAAAIVLGLVAAAIVLWWSQQ